MYFDFCVYVNGITINYNNIYCHWDADAKKYVRYGKHRIHMFMTLLTHWRVTLKLI